MKTAFLFPGQGSQAVGMGKDFYDNFLVAREVFQEVDDALDEKLSQLIFNGPIEELTLTENAQPAILATGIAILRTFMDAKNKKIEDLCQFVAGHSLGEYTALCAAEAISLKDAAKLVKLRGKSMQNSVPSGVGTMAAVLGAEKENIESILKQINKDSFICEIANDNCPGQIVISGHTLAIERACEEINAAGFRAKILQVSAPFHSSLMEPVKQVMQEAFSKVTINRPKVPLIANVLARQISNPDEITKALVDQVSGMVRWTESMQYLKTQDVSNLVEFGPGKVLTGMNKRINSEFTLTNILSLNDLD